MKNKIISLLKEIKIVCETQNIDFFISGELALCTYRKEPLKPDFNDATVLIFAKDVERLKKGLKKLPNRRIEDLTNNRNFPGYYLRYMDESTTLVNCDDSTFNYDTNSIGIDIEVICGCINRRFKDRLLNLIKRIWCRCHRAEYLNKYVDKRTTIKIALIKFLFVIIGTSSIMRRLFDLWTKMGTVKSNSVEIARNNGDIVTMNASVFNSKEYLIIEGERYPFVASLKLFVSKLYHGRFKRKPRKNEIFSEKITWEQYKRILDEKKIVLRAVQKKQKIYMVWKKRVYEPLRKKRSFYYNLLFCSEDRMKYYKEYNADKKLYILELYLQQDYDQLKEEMKEYLQALKDYAKKEIGFCFDREIFEIAMHLLIIEAKTDADRVADYDVSCKKVLKIIQNVPVHHFDSIKNIFWGKREEESVLLEEKKLVYKHALQLYDEYRIEFLTGD